MTEQELDQLMRRVLLDSLEPDCDTCLEEEIPFEASAGHRRQMQSMLADPMKWMRKRTRPAWKRALQQAAAVLLVLSLGLGGFVATVPTARAAFLRWVTEWYETHIIYQYAGDGLSGEMPQYGITALPDGFAETERDVLPGLVSVSYENTEGDTIDLTYVYMQQGAATVIGLEDITVYDVEVGGRRGRFFEAEIPGNFSTLTWIDEEENLQFTIDGCFDRMELLHIAESVSLVKPTK